MKNADGIEHCAQPATTVSATQVSHSRRKLLQKLSKLFLLQVDDLNKKYPVGSSCYYVKVKKDK